MRNNKAGSDLNVARGITRIVMIQIYYLERRRDNVLISCDCAEEKGLCPGTGFTIIREDFGWNDLRTAIAYQCVISRRGESRRKMKSPPLKNAQSLPGS